MNEKRSTPPSSQEAHPAQEDLPEEYRPDDPETAGQSKTPFDAMLPCEQISYLGGIKLANLWMLANRLREDFIVDVTFSDPPWDILMELHSAEARGDKVKLTSLSATARVPPSTSSRWVRVLTERGLVVSERDPDDKRRTNLRLSDKGRELMRAYFDALMRRATKIFDLGS